MSFLKSIPIIGDFVDQVGDAIDKNVTTDHERLTTKAKMMEIAGPVIMSVVQAQAAANELVVKLAQLESSNEDRMVRWRRPIIAYIAAINFIIMLWWWVTTYPGNIFDVTDVPFIVSYSFTFAAIVNGLDIGTRGLEKMVGKYSSSINGNGKH